MFEPRKKLYKPKRKAEGATWTPAQTDQKRAQQLEGQKKHKGVLCRDCGKIRVWTELKAKYEKNEFEEILRLWVCRHCGLVVRIDNMEEFGNGD